MPSGLLNSEKSWDFFDFEATKAELENLLINEEFFRDAEEYRCEFKLKKKGPNV